MTIVLVRQVVNMMKIENFDFSPQRNIMMLWKMDLNYCHLWSQQQKSLGRSHEVQTNSYLKQSQESYLQIERFVKTKRYNTEVWFILGNQIRDQECKLQEVQKLLAPSASYIVQTSSELSKQPVFSKQPTVDSFDVKVSLPLLKNALSLAAKLNQTINKLRRHFIKPSLSVQYSRLADIADDSSEHLFGDSVTDSLEFLEKKNERTAEKRAISIREKVTLLSTIVVKLKGLFQDPEKNTRSKALFKKVKSVSELEQQLQQLQQTQILSLIHQNLWKWKIKAMLKKGLKSLGKRYHSFPQQSPNIKASFKTLKKTQDQGHYVKRPSQFLNYYNNYNNCNRHSSTKEGHLLPKLQLETKETLIPFQNAWQVKKL